MALVQKRLTAKKRNLLAIIVLAFVGVSAILIIQNFWKPGATQPTGDELSGTINARDLPIYTDLGIDALQDSRWAELKMPKVKFPIAPGVVGRSNPFIDAPIKAAQ